MTSFKEKEVIFQDSFQQ